MRDQYVGDVSDLLKYALLRALASEDRQLGIAWYYNQTHDGRNDGRHTEYLAEDKWLSLDEGVLTALKSLRERSVESIQQSPFWPAGVRFHREPVPPRRLRTEWAAQMARDLEGSNFVFLDPDNGVGEGRRHANLDEVKLLRRSGERALVLIKFPARIAFDEQQKAFHDTLRSATGATNLLTLRTSIAVPSRNGLFVPRSRWFTLVDYDKILADRLVHFANKLSSIKGAKATVHQDG